MKSLVLYYSQTGTIKKVGEEFARQLGADIASYDVTVPYTGTFEEAIERCQKEMAEGTLPALAPLSIDLAQYDTVFLGFPIWFGNYAPPVAALLKSVDFSGKTLVPFCTFGSGGRVESRKALSAALPRAIVNEGYGLRVTRLEKMPAEVNRFLIEGGYVHGEIDKLPEYSALQPVTEEEAEIFNIACGDYQFPLGTPLRAGNRTTNESVDYKFISLSKDRKGNDAEFTIYITVEQGKKPEFTEVVRG